MADSSCHSPAEPDVHKEEALFELTYDSVADCNPSADLLISDDDLSEEDVDAIFTSLRSKIVELGAPEPSDTNTISGSSDRIGEGSYSATGLSGESGEGPAGLLGLTEANSSDEQSYLFYESLNGDEDSNESLPEGINHNKERADSDSDSVDSESLLDDSANDMEKRLTDSKATRFYDNRKKPGDGQRMPSRRMRVRINVTLNRRMGFFQNLPTRVVPVEQVPVLRQELYNLEIDRIHINRLMREYVDTVITVIDGKSFDVLRGNLITIEVPGSHENVLLHCLRHWPCERIATDINRPQLSTAMTWNDYPRMVHTFLSPKWFYSGLSELLQLIRTLNLLSILSSARDKIKEIYDEVDGVLIIKDGKVDEFTNSWLGTMRAILDSIPDVSHFNNLDRSEVDVIYLGWLGKHLKNCEELISKYHADFDEFFTDGDIDRTFYNLPKIRSHYERRLPSNTDRERRLNEVHTRLTRPSSRMHEYSRMIKDIIKQEFGGESISISFSGGASKDSGMTAALQFFESILEANNSDVELEMATECINVIHHAMGTRKAASALDSLRQNASSVCASLEYLREPKVAMCQAGLLNHNGTVEEIWTYLVYLKGLLAEVMYMEDAGYGYTPECKKRTLKDVLEERGHFVRHRRLVWYGCPEYCYMNEEGTHLTIVEVSLTNSYNEKRTQLRDSYSDVIKELKHAGVTVNLVLYVPSRQEFDDRFRDHALFTQLQIIRQCFGGLLDLPSLATRVTLTRMENVMSVRSKLKGYVTNLGVSKASLDRFAEKHGLCSKLQDAMDAVEREAEKPLSVVVEDCKKIASEVFDLVKQQINDGTSLIKLCDPIELADHLSDRDWSGECKTDNLTQCPYMESNGEDVTFTIGLDHLEAFRSLHAIESELSRVQKFKQSLNKKVMKLSYELIAMKCGLIYYTTQSGGVSLLDKSTRDCILRESVQINLMIEESVNKLTTKLADNKDIDPLFHRVLSLGLDDVDEDDIKVRNETVLRCFEAVCPFKLMSSQEKIEEVLADKEKPNNLLYDKSFKPAEDRLKTVRDWLSSISNTIRETSLSSATSLSPAVLDAIMKKCISAGAPRIITEHIQNVARFVEKTRIGQMCLLAELIGTAYLSSRATKVKCDMVMFERDGLTIMYPKPNSYSEDKVHRGVVVCGGKTFRNYHTKLNRTKNMSNVFFMGVRDAELYECAFSTLVMAAVSFLQLKNADLLSLDSIPAEIGGELKVLLSMVGILVLRNKKSEECFLMGHRYALMYAQGVCGDARIDKKVEINPFDTFSYILHMKLQRTLRECTPDHNFPICPITGYRITTPEQYIQCISYAHIFSIHLPKTRTDLGVWTDVLKHTPYTEALMSERPEAADGLDVIEDMTTKLFRKAPVWNRRFVLSFANHTYRTHNYSTVSFHPSRADGSVTQLTSTSGVVEEFLSQFKLNKVQTQLEKTQAIALCKRVFSGDLTHMMSKKAVGEIQDFLSRVSINKDLVREVVQIVTNTHGEKGHVTSLSDLMHPTASVSAYDVINYIKSNRIDPRWYKMNRKDREKGRGKKEENEKDADTATTSGAEDPESSKEKEKENGRSSNREANPDNLFSREDEEEYELVLLTAEELVNNLIAFRENAKHHIGEPQETTRINSLWRSLGNSSPKVFIKLLHKFLKVFPVTPSVSRAFTDYSKEAKEMFSIYGIDASGYIEDGQIHESIIYNTYSESEIKALVCCKLLKVKGTMSFEADYTRPYDRFIDNIALANLESESEYTQQEVLQLMLDYRKMAGAQYKHALKAFTAGYKPALPRSKRTKMLYHVTDHVLNSDGTNVIALANEYMDTDELYNFEADAKEQLGGDRAIFSGDRETKMQIRPLEAIARSLNKALPNETMHSPKVKQANLNRSLLMVTENRDCVCHNNDCGTWGPLLNALMMLMVVILFVKQMGADGDFINYIWKAALKHVTKRIALPRRPLELYIMKCLKRSRGETVRMGIPDWLEKIFSKMTESEDCAIESPQGMLAGILHDVSSFFITTVFTSYTQFIRPLVAEEMSVLGQKVRCDKSPKPIYNVALSYMQSSDDSSKIFDGRKVVDGRLVPVSRAVASAASLIVQNLVAQGFGNCCARLSPKSVASINFFEFNQNYIFKNHERVSFIPARAKFSFPFLRLKSLIGPNELYNYTTSSCMQSLENGNSMQEAVIITWKQYTRVYNWLKCDLNSRQMNHMLFHPMLGGVPTLHPSILLDPSEGGRFSSESAVCIRIGSMSEETITQYASCLENLVKVEGGTTGALRYRRDATSKRDFHYDYLKPESMLAATKKFKDAKKQVLTSAVEEPLFYLMRDEKPVSRIAEIHRIESCYTSQSIIRGLVREGVSTNYAIASSSFRSNKIKCTDKLKDLLGTQNEVVSMRDIVLSVPDGAHRKRTRVEKVNIATDLLVMQNTKLVEEWFEKPYNNPWQKMKVKTSDTRLSEMSRPKLALCVKLNPIWALENYAASLKSESVISDLATLEAYFNHLVTPLQELILQLENSDIMHDEKQAQLLQLESMIADFDDECERAKESRRSCFLIEDCTRGSGESIVVSCWSTWKFFPVFSSDAVRDILSHNPAATAYDVLGFVSCMYKSPEPKITAKRCKETPEYKSLVRTCKRLPPTDRNAHLMVLLCPLDDDPMINLNKRISSTFAAKLSVREIQTTSYVVYEVHKYPSFMGLSTLFGVTTLYTNTRNQETLSELSIGLFGLKSFGYRTEDVAELRKVINSAKMSDLAVGLVRLVQSVVTVTAFTDDEGRVTVGHGNLMQVENCLTGRLQVGGFSASPNVSVFPETNQNGSKLKVVVGSAPTFRQRMRDDDLVPSQLFKLFSYIRFKKESTAVEKKYFSHLTLGKPHLVWETGQDAVPQEQTQWDDIVASVKEDLRLHSQLIGVHQTSEMLMDQGYSPLAVLEAVEQIGGFCSINEDVQEDQEDDIEVTIVTHGSGQDEVSTSEEDEEEESDENSTADENKEVSEDSSTDDSDEDDIIEDEEGKPEIEYKNTEKWRKVYESIKLKKAKLMKKHKRLKKQRQKDLEDKEKSRVVGVESSLFHAPCCTYLIGRSPEITYMTNRRVLSDGKLTVTRRIDLISRSIIFTRPKEGTLLRAFLTRIPHSLVNRGKEASVEIARLPLCALWCLITRRKVSQRLLCAMILDSVTSPAWIINLAKNPETTVEDWIARALGHDKRCCQLMQ